MIHIKHMNQKLKKCDKCKIEKELDCFVNRVDLKRFADGKNSWCKSCNRNARRVMKYGITNDDYNQMLINQDYKCAICHTHQDNLNKKANTIYNTLCIDHCHKTNIVRGLLCHRCNRSIGLLKDDSEVLYQAHLYLKKYENKI